MSTPPTAEIRAATEEEAGRTCPYCRFAFKLGAPLALCPACHAPHHEECWGDNHGCAIVGCSATPPAWMTRPAPEEATAAQRGVPAPPPPVMSAAASSSSPPPSPPSPRPRLSPVVVVLLVGALAAAGAAGAVVATRGHGGSAPSSGSQQAQITQSTTTAAPVVQPAGQTDTETTSTPPVAASSASADRAAVVGLLHRYEDAYSSHSLSGLRAIMNPSVTRHGLRAGGCDDTTGRSAVLEAYAEQFANGTGTYTLHGLSDRAVTLNGSSATAALTYSIGGGGSGDVAFDLRRFPVGWRISHIQASC